MQYIQNGKQIEKIFLKASKESNPNILLYRINDFYDKNSFVYLNNVISADFIASYKGLFCCIELKETYNKISFNVYKIKPHQKQFLKIIHKNSGVALVGIHFIAIKKLFVLPLYEINKYSNKGLLKLSFLLDNYVSFSTENSSIKLLSYIEEVVNNYCRE